MKLKEPISEGRPAWVIGIALLVLGTVLAALLWSSIKDWL